MTNQQKAQDTFLKTTVPVDPFVLGYNLHGSDITQFVEIYLERVGIPNAIVHLEAINEGTVNPKLGLVVMFERNNAAIIRNGGGGREEGVDMLPVFANRTQTGGLRASQDLEKAIAGLRLEKKTKVYRSQKNKNYVYIPLSPIRTIALMLGVQRQVSKVNIIGVSTVKGEVVVTAFKQRKHTNINPTRNNDLYGEDMNRHFN